MRTFIGAAARTGALTVFEPELTPVGKVLRYCPDGIFNDGNCMPVFMVYGDKAFTEESAKAVLEQWGLAELAADANCNILFVSPIEDSWGAADVDMYLQIRRKLAAAYGGENGLQRAMDFRTRQPAGYRMLGSDNHMFLLADGKGADFVAEMLVGDGLFVTNPNGDEAAAHPTGVMLCNTTVMPKLGRLGMPAYVVNGTAEQTADFAASLQQDHPAVRLVCDAVSEVKSGFDPALVMDAWQKVFFHVRRKEDGSGPDLYPIPTYDGFVLKDETVEISTGAFRYLTWLPEELDMSREAAYPLVLGLHGGSDDALYYGWCSEWPLIAKANGFVAIMVDQHVHRKADEVVELLQHILKEYPAIDPGKVYASGFSMGSMKSWGCGLGYTTFFAGIAPMDASGRESPEGEMTTFDGVTIDYEHVIPTFYVAGELDFLPVGPNQKQADGSIYTGCNSLMNALFHKNGTGSYTFDPEGDDYWGLKGRVESLTEGHMTAYAHYVANPDGVEYAAFCNVRGQMHAQMGLSCRMAWQFLRQFRRMPDGSIVLE